MDDQRAPVYKLWVTLTCISLVWVAARILLVEQEAPHTPVEEIQQLLKERPQMETAAIHPPENTDLLLP